MIQVVCIGFHHSHVLAKANSPDLKALFPRGCLIFDPESFRGKGLYLHPKNGSGKIWEAKKMNGTGADNVENDHHPHSRRSCGYFLVFKRRPPQEPPQQGSWKFIFICAPSGFSSFNPSN